MSPSSRRKLFRVSVTDQIRSAWTRLQWPSPGKGEVDDPSRGLPFFRSYGKRVTNVSEEWPDGNTFRDFGRRSPGINLNPLGMFTLPIIPISSGRIGFHGVNGVMIAGANPLRSRLLIRFSGPNNTTVFLSDQEFITSYAYRVEFADPSETEYVSQGAVYAAAVIIGSAVVPFNSRSSAFLFVAAEERES